MDRERWRKVLEVQEQHSLDECMGSAVAGNEEENCGQGAKRGRVGRL